ncbi:MAG: hypothetical protein ACOX3K_05575 [Bacilli bacterium]|jgi:hypothetical protein
MNTEIEVSSIPTCKEETLKRYFRQLNFQQLGIILGNAAILGIVISFFITLGQQFIIFGLMVVVMAMLIIILIIILFTIGTIFIYYPEVIGRLWEIVVSVTSNTERVSEIMQGAFAFLPFVTMATVLFSIASCLILHFSRLQYAKSKLIVNLICAAMGLAAFIISVIGGGT